MRSGKRGVSRKAMASTVARHRGADLAAQHRGVLQRGFAACNLRAGHADVDDVAAGRAHGGAGAAAEHWLGAALAGNAPAARRNEATVGEEAGEQAGELAADLRQKAADAAARSAFGERAKEVRGRAGKRLGHQLARDDAQDVILQALQYIAQALAADDRVLEGAAERQAQFARGVDAFLGGLLDIVVHGAGSSAHCFGPLLYGNLSFRESLVDEGDPLVQRLQLACRSFAQDVIEALLFIGQLVHRFLRGTRCGVELGDVLGDLREGAVRHGNSRLGDAEQLVEFGAQPNQLVLVGVLDQLERVLERRAHLWTDEILQISLGLWSAAGLAATGDVGQ